jgi:galactokinase
MTGADAAAALVDRGLDPVEVPAKRALFDRVLGAHTPEPHAPRFVWWVPGRLEVFGKHTDYAGGRTLVCAVPRGLAVAASPRRDGAIHVHDAGRGESVALEAPGLPGGTPPQFKGWRHYVEVVAGRLARNFPGAALGADLVFASDLPRAAGMSSSSALVIGIAAALVRVGEIEARREWQANVRGVLDAAGYYACLENGMTFGTLEGDAGVGTHGGSEDHAAILTGASGFLSAFAFVPMRRIAAVAVPACWRFVLAPCGVPSEKTGAAQDSYNRLAEGTRLLLDLWNQSESPAASLGAAIAADPSSADRLRRLVQPSAIAGWSAAALEKRLDHFIREDARIAAALEAFGASDRGALADISSGSQADAETLLGNQIPATISLAGAARAQGAFAATSFGAGFGGSVWALVDREIADPFVERWHPGAFVAAPGPALTELSKAEG